MGLVGATTFQVGNPKGGVDEKENSHWELNKFQLNWLNLECTVTLAGITLVYNQLLLLSRLVIVSLEVGESRLQSAENQ